MIIFDKNFSKNQFLNHNKQLIICTHILLQSFIEERKVQWLLGYTPKDQPDCGFDGEKCLYQIGKHYIFRD